jgi:hypothetical protein
VTDLPKVKLSKERPGNTVHSYNPYVSDQNILRIQVGASPFDSGLGHVFSVVFLHPFFQAKRIDTIYLGLI